MHIHCYSILRVSEVKYAGIKKKHVNKTEKYAIKTETKRDGVV